MARALKRLGLGHLRNLEPNPPVQRYEHETQGDLIHIDAKKRARFRKGATASRGPAAVPLDWRRPQPGQVVIDDALQLAYIEVLQVDKQTTTVGFLLRAVAWFGRQGISCKRVLSDNGSAYRSRPGR